MILSMVAATAAIAPTASAAETDTYGWSTAPCEFGAGGGASCTNPNNSHDKYDWYVDENHDGRFTGGPCVGAGASAECFDNFGYQYRNCTSYVAQKINQVFGKNISGWYNAADWATSAQAAGYKLDASPKPGDIAVWGTEVGSGFGHVAYVYDASNGIGKLDEYNVAGTGTFSSSRTTANGSAGPADWYIHMGTPPGTGGGGSTAKPSPVFAYGGGKIAKDIKSDGYNQLYTATPAGVYESYWLPGSGNGVSTWQVNSLANITGIQKLITSDGYHHVFTDTAVGVYETYWKPGVGGVSTSPINTLTGGVGLAADREGDGHFQVYTATSAGVYESYWLPGNGAGISTWQVNSLANVVSVRKLITPDGYHHVFTLTSGGVYESYWKPGVTGVSTSPINSLSGGVSLAVDQGADGYFQVYTGTSSGVYETYWKPGNGAGISTWQVNTISGVVDIAKDIEADGGQQLYTATSDGVYETYWAPGPVSTWLVVSEAGVVATAKDVESNGWQQVYTGTSSGTYETYWNPGVQGTLSTWQVNSLTVG